MPSANHAEALDVLHRFPSIQVARCSELRSTGRTRWSGSTRRAGNLRGTRTEPASRTPRRARYRPNVVTLEIGANDLNGNYQIPTAPDRLRALIHRITSDGADATVLVGTVIVSTSGTEEADRPAPGTESRRRACVPACPHQAPTP
ncbi:GDSL-type esterase/lipase family protein [Streptomyces sp. NPDC058291]|uniref:GDSL-type esterase/lipase family protein n=1 Tax=Streptomyces sp. NPDC058291 TaxID=3346427 RepID=UPI0036ECE2EA